MAEPILAVYRRFTTLCSNYTQYFYSLSPTMTIRSEKMMESPKKEPSKATIGMIPQCLFIIPTSCVTW